MKKKEVVEENEEAVYGFILKLKNLGHYLVNSMNKFQRRK